LAAHNLDSIIQIEGCEAA